MASLAVLQSTAMDKI